MIGHDSKRDGESKGEVAVTECGGEKYLFRLKGRSNTEGNQTQRPGGEKGIEKIHSYKRARGEVQPQEEEKKGREEIKSSESDKQRKGEGGGGANKYRKLKKNKNEKN